MSYIMGQFGVTIVKGAPPIIQEILQFSVWFRDTNSLGHLYSMRFSVDGIALRNEFIAFAITAFKLAISSKMSGGKVTPNAQGQDGSDTWGEKYQLNLDVLEGPNVVSMMYKYHTVIHAVGQ
ncbi:hypothetical protein BV22DRAFT_1050954 [Leucogyrophana mollusca]|uniref:Uncharacterized protein n=1 Tax=Leucogyrophana mollusca TaxID=85980 RepID=A0ACB8B221_9AGAM|nr:hypothetical protein BV22DRAFT_1050954 [Leucogyrophana mollusca]